MSTFSTFLKDDYSVICFLLTLEEFLDYTRRLGLSSLMHHNVSTNKLSCCISPSHHTKIIVQSSYVALIIYLFIHQSSMISTINVWDKGRFFTANESISHLGKWKVRITVWASRISRELMMRENIRPRSKRSAGYERRWPSSEEPRRSETGPDISRGKGVRVDLSFVHETHVVCYNQVDLQLQGDVTFIVRHYFATFIM